MTNSTHEKIKNQLGVSYTVARYRLSRLLLFQLIQESKKDICCRCGQCISSIEEFSIDHKTPYLDTTNPKELFFDLSNIGFSHLKCNSAATRGRKYFTEKDRKDAINDRTRAYKRRVYTTEKRRIRKETTGW